MNHSRNKNYSNSPGFVYFNASSPKDTQDFIAFNDRSPSNYNHNYNRPYSSNYESPNFYGSPRSGKFNHRNSHRYSSGYKGRSFHSPHNSYNNSWGDKRGRKYFNPRQSCNNAPMMSRDGTRDVSMFYDHTSVLDPWEHLEKDLKTSERLENAESLEMSEPEKSEEAAVKTVDKESSSSSDDEDSTKSSSSENKEDKSEEQKTS